MLTPPASQDGEVQEDGFFGSLFQEAEPGSSDAKTAQMLGKATMMRRMACSQLLQEMHLGFGAPCAFDLWVLYALSSQACARGRLEPTFQDWLISDDRLVTIWTSSLALSSSQTATVLSILFSCLVSAAESHTPLSAEAPVEMRPEGLQMLLIGLMVLLAGAETGLPTWLTILLQPALQVPDSTSNPRNPDQASKPSIRALRLASAWLPQPQTAAIDLLSPLCNWARQLFCSLVSLARSANSQLEADLSSSEGSRQTVHELLSLCLPMDQACSALDKVDLHLGARYAAVFQKGRPRDACALLAEQTGIESQGGSDPILMRLIQPWLIDSPSASSALLFSLQMAADSSCRAACQLLSLSRSSNTMPSQEQSAWSEILEACQDLRASAELVQQSMLAINTLALAKNVEADDLRDVLIEAAVSTSRSVLSCPPYAEDVSPLIQGLFEALTVGSSQSDKHILVGLSLLMHSGPQAKEDIMQLLSILLASASQTGMAGLEPLLQFPALMCEHLSSGHLHCQAALHLMPVLSFVRDLLYFAAQPTPLAPAVLPAEAQEDSASQTIANGPVAAELATTDATTAQSLNAGEETEFEDAEGVGLEESEDDDGIGEEDMLDEEEIAEVLEAEEDQMQLQVIDEQAFQEVVNDLAVSDPASAAALRRAAELSATAPGTRNAVFEHAQAIADQAVGQLSEAELRPVNVGSAETGWQCSYVGSGKQYVEQHWFFCYTCNLVESKGCCSACARTCHAGHDLVYSGRSRFYCDCGAGIPGVPACKFELPAQIEIGQVDGQQPLVMQQQHVYKIPTLEPKAASRFTGSVWGLLNMESMATSNAVNTNSGGNHIVNFTPTLTGRHDAMFDVAFLCFDRVSGLRLIIAGLENVQVWSLSDTGKPQDRLPVVLPMDSSNSASTLGVYGSCITQVDWLPGTMVKLAIAAQQQVFVYDLSVAADAPVVVIQLPQTQARLAAFTIFRDMLLSADSSEKRSGTACPIMLLLTDKLEVHRARLPQSCSAHSLGQAQPPATPQILAAEPLPIPAAYQAPSGSQDNSHTNAHTIMCEARGDQNFGCLTSPLIEVPLLPLARRELATPALLAAHLSTPSAEVASPMLMAWQGAEGARSPALATQQLQMSQSTAEGLACMMLPQLQQTILVALDSRSQLHVFYTPQPAGMYHEESFVMPDVPSGGRSAEQTTPASPLSDMSPATYAAHLLGMRLPSRGSSSQRNAMARRSAVAFAMDRQSAGSPRARGLSEPGDVPASTLVYPMETFESCQTIMADTIISGDIGQAGGAAALKAALRDVAAAVEAPSLQGMKLILRSDNSSLAIIGIRILVGVTGASHTPSEALLGERRTQFSENGQRRWYLLALSPEEAVRMHPNVTLLVGAACNPAVKPRIDGLEVFALPLADVKTQDIIALKPNIAVEWQPGSIVIYSAWAIQAHAFPGDAWSVALETLDKASLSMAQAAIHEGLEQGKAAAQRPVPESLGWVLLAAFNQVLHIFGQKPPAGQTLTARELCLSCNAVEGMMAQSHADHLPCAVAPGLAMALASSGLCLSDAGRASASNKDIICGLLLHPREEVRRAALQCLCAGLQQAEGRSLDDGWASPGAYVQLAGHIVTQTHGAAGWEALCSFQFLNFIAVSLPVSAESKETVVGGVLAAVSKAAIDWEDTRGQRDHIQVLRLMTMANIATHLQGNMEGTPESSESQQKRDPSLVKLAQMPGLLPFLLKILQKSVTSTRKAQGPSNGIQASALGCGELLSEPIPSCSDPRSSANKDVLQPFADQASVKAAGSRLFLDVEAAQARAVITVACAISSHAGSAMTEGSAKGAWRQVLCKALVVEELAACRKSIRRVLLHICGGHSAYRDAKATYSLQAALQLICHAMPTPDDLKVARPDKSLGEADHSWLWPPLASSASALRDPAALQASRLAHIFAKQALGSPAAALRRAACSVVQGLWRYLVLHGRRKLSAAVALLQTLLEWLPHFAAHGKASLEAFQLVSSLLEGGDQFKPKAAPSESSEESGARKGKAGKATKAETGAAPGTPPYAGRAGMFVREALESKAIAGAFAALQHQNQVLSNHPLASAYQQLKELLDFQGFFLEDDVHYAAHEPRFEQLKLESVEAETKFTDSQIMARLQGIFAIKGFSLQIKDQTPSRMVRTLNIHMCNLPLSELSDLKGRPEVWEKALSLHVAPRQSEVKHQVSVPITASCLMIEFADFWTDLNEASTEVLQCPRCSHLVSDPHGVCRFCRENAFQCRHCRNINYEKLDGFLCNECGRSRHARFECSVTAAPLGHFPVPANDIEMSQALVGLQDAADMVHEKRTALSSLRGSVLTALGSMQASTPASSSIPGPAQSSTAGTKGVAKPVVQLGSLYLDKCKPAAEALAHSTRYLQHIQAALSTRSRRHGLANAQGSQPAALLQPGASYGSAEQFVESMMAVLGLIVQNSPGPALQAVVGSDIVTELFVCNLKKGTAQGRIAASALLVGIAHKVKSARLDLAALIRGRVMYALKQHRALDVAAATQDEISLLSKLMVPKGRHQIDQQAWEAQLQLVLHLLAQAIDVASKHPATTQHVIMPCLRILLGILKPGLQAAAPAGTPSKASVKTKPKVSNGSARNQKPTSNGSYAPGVPYGQEGTGPVVSIQEFQEGHAGLATYQDRFSDAAAAAAKMRGGKLDRSSRLATMCAHHWRAWACRRASHRSASIGPSPGTSAGLAPALGIGMLQGKKLIASLLLSPTGPGVRELAAELFQSLCRGSSHLRFNLLARFVELLPDAVVTGEHAAEYFSTLTSLLDEEAAVAMLTSMSAFSGTAELPAQADTGWQLWRALFVVAGLSSLIIQRSKLTGDAEVMLEEFLQSSVTAGEKPARTAYAKAGLALLGGLWQSEATSGAAGQLYRLSPGLLYQICWAIKPEKQDVPYLLVLEKSGTQEEYIRGSLPHNPYFSTQVGPLMRNVKNFICEQLDLAGLIDDDFAGTAQATPNRADQEPIGPAMIVTFRLQGLDGEATEPMVNELKEQEATEAGSEEEFAVARALLDGSFLPQLLHRLQARETVGFQESAESTLLLRLLHQAVHLDECRVALLQQGGLPKLLSALNRALAPIRQAAAAKEGQAASASAASETAGVTGTLASFPLAAEDLISLLASLEQLARAQSSHPGLVRDLGAEEDARASTERRRLHRAPATRSNSKSCRAFCKANKRPGLLYALQLLRALVSQHQAGALALAGAPHLLPLLHLLEGPGNVQQIGSAAEILLEEIAEAAGSEIKDEIDSLRNATRARMRELALRNRQATLAAMGMQQVGPTARLQAAEGSQLAQAFAEMEEESGEESELVCMVCKEGYATAPRQLLGTYCFCTVAAASEHPAIAPPPSILAALPSTAAQQVHMTVSHFNLIHFDCHAAARRADSSLRVAKREWEGATLRNGGTLTNNLLPVKGKDVPGGAVAAAVATFLDNLAIVGAAQGTSASRARSRTAVIPSHVQVSLVASDIASVLERFASGSSFSEQSHGGGRESNSYLLPYLVQLGRYLASCCSASDRQGLHQEVAALGKPVNESMQSLASATAVQKLPHALALSLLLMSLDEWQAATLPSLQHTLCHALHVRQQIGKEIANGQCSTEPRGLFAKCAPLLRFFFLINQIQHALKPPGKDWATEMDTRLEALQATMETSRGFMELLSQLEEAESFQEMLDLTNLLPLVLKTHEGADALLQASAALSTDMLHPET
ncbi:hypothetical protein WJX84_004776 [Apatococcus fuscideae]|uniref:UBR-type domain-containing protein n=1 Tax=Apatococcus fuscideae TaxID=2026836 RepID=A0AAW1T1X9_9CHLO